MSTYPWMTIQMPTNKEIFFVEIVEINEHGSKPTHFAWRNDIFTFRN